MTPHFPRRSLQDFKGAGLTNPRSAAPQERCIIQRQIRVHRELHAILARLWRALHGAARQIVRHASSTVNCMYDCPHIQSSQRGWTRLIRDSHKHWTENTPSCGRQKSCRAPPAAHRSRSGRDPPPSSPLPTPAQRRHHRSGFAL